jgi:hypothetical protein
VVAQQVVNVHFAPVLTNRLRWSLESCYKLAVT